jgi:hypothetical protein
VQRLPGQLHLYSTGKVENGSQPLASGLELSFEPAFCPAEGGFHAYAA